MVQKGGRPPPPPKRAVRQLWARDTVRELEGHVMQSGNWRGTLYSLGTGGARDTVWELEGHVIQSGNWRGT